MRKKQDKESETMEIYQKIWQKIEQTIEEKPECHLCGEEAVRYCEICKKPMCLAHFTTLPLPPHIRVYHTCFSCWRTNILGYYFKYLLAFFTALVVISIVVVIVFY